MCFTYCPIFLAMIANVLRPWNIEKTLFWGLNWDLYICNDYTRRYLAEKFHVHKNESKEIPKFSVNQFSSCVVIIERKIF